MINPAVETDLVGDLIELRSFRSTSDGGWVRALVARGRVRAVTVNTDNYGMGMWLEILDDTCITACEWGGGGPDKSDIVIGDIVFVVASNTCMLRLVRGVP